MMSSKTVRLAAALAGTLLATFSRCNQTMVICRDWNLTQLSAADLLCGAGVPRTENALVLLFFLLALQLSAREDFAAVRVLALGSRRRLFVVQLRRLLGMTVLWSVWTLGWGMFFSALWRLPLINWSQYSSEYVLHLKYPVDLSFGWVALRAVWTVFFQLLCLGLAVLLWTMLSRKHWPACFVCLIPYIADIRLAYTESLVFQRLSLSWESLDLRVPYSGWFFALPAIAAVVLAVLFWPACRRKEFI